MVSVVAENLIPLVFAVLTPIILMFVHRWMSILAHKWGVQTVKEKYEAKVDELIVMGIKAAEKKSVSLLKKKGGKKTPGEEKLSQVLEFVNVYLKDNKLPEKAGGELAVRIEAALFDETDKQ